MSAGKADELVEVFAELSEEERAGSRIHVERAHWSSGRKRIVIDVWPGGKEGEDIDRFN